MRLHGKGMLIVFKEVKAANERDFSEWYNREHIDERVNLSGSHRAPAATCASQHGERGMPARPTLARRTNKALQLPITQSGLDAQEGAFVPPPCPSDWSP
jgi:hypothetical protein